MDMQTKFFQLLAFTIILGIVGGIIHASYFYKSPTKEEVQTWSPGRGAISGGYKLNK